MSCCNKALHNMNWSNRISTPVQNAINIYFWFFKCKDENFKINSRCSVNESRYVREHAASLLYKLLDSTDTYVRKCRTYSCVPFSYAAIAQKNFFFAVSVMRYAPSKEKWWLKLSDVQCNWLNALPQNFPIQSFVKIVSGTQVWCAYGRTESF